MDQEHWWPISTLRVGQGAKNRKNVEAIPYANLVCFQCTYVHSLCICQYKPINITHKIKTRLQIYFDAINEFAIGLVYGQINHPLQTNQVAGWVLFRSYYDKDSNTAYPETQS